MAFCFGGKAKIVVKAEGEETKEIIISDGDRVIEVDFNEVHAIKNIDDHDIYVCALADQLFDRETYSDNKKEIIIK